MATQRHHHHHSYVQTSAEPAAAAPAAAAPAEAAADAGAAGAAADAAAAKAEVAEANPTAEQVKAEAAAVLVPKKADQSSEAQRTWAESRADDAAEAASVAKHDALGKTIFADMYATRAQGKLDSAAAAEKSANDMVEVLKARMEVNAAAEKTRQATAFKAHKAHVLHVKEHYANLEAAAAREVADAHSAWKARYNGQKRLPLDTAGETWVANMPDHVIENPDFHVKAQLQSRRSWPMPPREKPPPKPSLLKVPSQLQEPPQPPQLKVLPLPQLPQPPQLLSSNFTRAETSPKRELPLNPNLNHQDLNLHPAQAETHPPTEVNKKRSTFSDREFVFKEFK